MSNETYLHEGKNGNIEVKVSLKYIRLKKQARENLRSEDGYALSVRRMIERKVCLDK